MLPSKRIAVAGLGAIGRALARRLAQGLPGLALACVAVRDRGKAEAWMREEGIDCPIVPLSELPEHADLAVEAAPARVLEAICRPMLEAGKQVMVLSAGALLPRPSPVPTGKVPRRADHCAHRSLAGSRRGHRRGGGADPFRAHDHAQTAAWVARRAL